MRVSYLNWPKSVNLSLSTWNLDMCFIVKFSAFPFNLQHNNRYPTRLVTKPHQKSPPKENLKEFAELPNQKKLDTIISKCNRKTYLALSWFTSNSTLLTCRGSSTGILSSGIPLSIIPLNSSRRARSLSSTRPKVLITLSTALPTKFTLPRIRPKKRKTCWIVSTTAM